MALKYHRTKRVALVDRYVCCGNFACCPCRVFYPSSVCLKIYVLILTSICVIFFTYFFYLTCVHDTLFNHYTLICGHLFYKSCACGVASIYNFQGVKSAPPEANNLYAQRYVRNPTCCQTSFFVAMKLVFSMASSICDMFSFIASHKLSARM